MNVVCFGQQNWDHCWTAKQQILTRLARRGHRILYVNPDLDPEVDARRQWAALKWGRDAIGLREVRESLHVLTQGDSPAWLGRRVRAKLRYLGVRACCERLQLLAPVVLALRPDRLWLMRAASPAAMAYYAVDEWTGFGGLSETSKAHLRAREEELLREVDVALAVSPRLADRFRQIQPNTHRLENGADVEHFSPAALRRAAPHPALVTLPKPRIGFVGQVDERLDQDLLLELADARPDWNFVIVGRVKPGTDVSRLQARESFHLLGYQPYEHLPGVLRDIAVCIVPYRRTDLTESCNPLKVYEYLATGRPVVSVPLEGLQACREAVALAETPEEFAGAIAAALAAPDARREGGLAVAAANSWSHRVEELERHFDNARAAASSRPSRCWTSGRRVSWIPVRLDAKEQSLRHVHYGYERARLRGSLRMAYVASRAGGAAYYMLRVASRAVGRLAGDAWPLGVRKILVARRGFLGDTIAVLPTLMALRRRYPHARIVLAVQPGFNSAAVLEASQYVDEIRPLSFCSRGRVGRLKGMLQLFAEGYDLLVTGIWYSLVPEAVYCGAPRRVGLYDGHPQQELCSRVVPLDPNRHEADNHLALVEALGERLDLPSRIPRLKLDDRKLTAAWDRLHEMLSVPQGVPIVVLHPGSKRESRRWPAERFGELTDRLLERHPDLHAVFTGTAGEAELVNGILGRLSAGVRRRAISSIGMTDLISLAALVHSAKLVVCNDTGIMHMARACGVPLVAVLGPENDRRWGPYPVGTAPAISVRSVVPCAPCARDQCDSLYCLRSMPVERVLEAAEMLLSRAPGRSTASVPLPVLGTVEETLYDTDRRATSLSWQALAEAGFALPVVSVLLLPTDAVLQNGTAEARRAFYRSIAWRPYPNLELVMVERDGIAVPPAPDPAAEDCDWSQALPPLTRVRVAPHADTGACIAAGVEAARGHLVIVTRGLSALPADRFGDDVATYVRGPAAVPVNADGRAQHLGPLADKPLEAACEMTWPREMLAEWLRERRHHVADIARVGAAPSATDDPGAVVPEITTMVQLTRLRSFVRDRARRWKRQREAGARVGRTTLSSTTRAPEVARSTRGPQHGVEADEHGN